MNITQNINNALQLQYSIGRGKGVHSIPPPSRLGAAETQSRFKPAFNKSNQIKFIFSKMQDKYATTTLRIAEHRQENMAKPEGLKHTKLLALLLR